MSQLISTRSKRGINELGTFWKLLSGTPVHDDLITIQNKINDFIKNNNQQFFINSKFFNEVKSLSDTLKHFY